MITTRDQLIDSLANKSSRIVIDKGSLGSTTVGGYHSLWRATGTPAQAALPTAAAIPTNATVGALNFEQQTAPATSYLGHMYATSSNNAMALEIRDRVGHMGGLSGTVVTAQNVGLDLLTLGLPAARRGDANFSDVQWFLEWFADTGATASNATINVTYDDGSVGNLALIAVGATVRNSRMLPLNPAANGRYIRGVNTVTLSASTATAGNFGVTATRMRAVIPMPLANFTTVMEWAQLGLPEVPNDACLMLNVITSTTTTGTLRAGGKLIHG
jgi:hypothetical protein